MKKRKKRVSRLEKTRQKKEIRQAVIYLSLSLILMVVLFIWGIPTLARLAGFLSKDETGTVELNPQTTIPLTAPFLTDVPEATNSAELELSGTAESGSEVEIYLNNLLIDKVVADKDGKFSLPIKLKNGLNWLYAQAKKGNQISPKSKEYQINFDKVPPKITILTPASDKTEFNGSDEQVITISGETDKEIDEAKIGDRIAIIEDGTKFKTDYTLAEGDNNIEIVVKDKAGNETKTELKLNWRP